MNKALGYYLRRARLAARLTQQEMADQLGVHRVVYAEYEAGKFPPSLPQAWQISRTLGVPIEDLARLAAEETADE